MAEEKVYDPLDYANLTKNLVRELMDRGPFPLPPKKPFLGPGIYALFYNGGYSLYSPAFSPDSSQPIYVGKAVPAGARKGGREAEAQMLDGTLYRRLAEHARSISESENLHLEHFTCRYLVVVPLWITMAERFLIEFYRPLWNVCVEGFGIHDPGKGRHAGEISWWDALHPGRRWAKNLAQTRSLSQAEERVRAFFAGREPSPPVDSDESD